jgi:hypothetical protein
MLSTRLGYRRPAFFARARAFALAAALSFRRACFGLGLARFQGGRFADGRFAALLVRVLMADGDAIASPISRTPYLSLICR